MANSSKTLMLLTVPVAVALIIVGGFIHASHSLSANVQDTVDRLVNTYVSIGKQHALPLMDHPHLTVRQKRMLRDIAETHRALEEEGALEMRVELVQDFQTQTHAFMRSIGTSSGQLLLADHQHFQDLTWEMGEQGNVRMLIAQYNDVAAQWNEGGGAGIASLVTLEGEREDALPLLRFNGAEADVGDVTI